MTASQSHYETIILELLCSHFDSTVHVSIGAAKRFTNVVHLWEHIHCEFSYLICLSPQPFWKLLDHRSSWLSHLSQAHKWLRVNVDVIFSRVEIVFEREQNSSASVSLSGPVWSSPVFWAFHYKMDPSSRFESSHFLAPVGCRCIEKWNEPVRAALLLKPVDWPKVITTKESVCILFTARNLLLNIIKCFVYTKNQKPSGKKWAAGWPPLLLLLLTSLRMCHGGPTLSENAHLNCLDRSEPKRTGPFSGNEAVKSTPIIFWSVV